MGILVRSLVALAAATCLQSAWSADPPIDTAAIESALGLQGTYSKDENVFKVTKTRDDVKVDVDGWTMPPFMGLTSWAAFTPMGRRTMVMGDTVLFEDEVDPAMSAALDNGLEVTALHNHFFFDQPKVYFMHIGGMGDAPKLAAAVKAVYDRVAQVRAARPSPASAFGGDPILSPSRVSSTPIEAVLGKSQSKDGMVKVTIGRPASMGGTAIGSEMGVNTWAAFAGSDDNAVVDGDFAMRENELQPVLRAMRGGGIHIVAIHQHMTQETPRIMFLHYWGKGKAADLARTIRQALDAQKAVR